MEKKDKQKKRAVKIAKIFQWSIILLAAGLLFYNWKLSIIALIWYLVNGSVYEKACEWQCIDEIDTPDPVRGLKIMLQGQPVLILLLTIAVILVLANYPIIAIVYSLFAFPVFCGYTEMKLFFF